MASIDRGSRLTYAQLKAHFDGIAHTVQHLADAVGDDFTSFLTSGYSDSTIARDVDISIDGATTGLVGLSSVNALARIAPPLDAIRRALTEQTNAMTTRLMVAAGYGAYVRALMDTFAQGYDDTYSDFWAAFAALYTSGQYVPGEVVDIMNAVGIKVDPAYTYPPEHKLYGIAEITGDAAGTLTVYDEIDPLLYTVHSTANTEWYILDRADGSPTDLTLTLSDARDEDDSPTDTGATDFVAAPSTGVAAAVGAVTQTDSKLLQSLRGSTMTVTGGENGDTIAIRVKTLRSMAFPT